MAARWPLRPLRPLQGTIGFLLLWLTAPLATVAIRPCEEAFLKHTEMVPHGSTTNRKLEGLGLDAVYVTTYSPLRDRRKRMEERFDKLGLRVNFITGWDQEVVTDEVVGCFYPSNALFAQAAREMNFKLTWFRVGELSLSIKHAFAYYDAVQRGHRHILVSEDDAYFSPSFADTLAELLAADGSQYALPSDYDLCFVCNYARPTAAELGRPKRLRRAADGEKQLHGMCAYLVSQKGARWLLDKMPFNGPADLQVTHWNFPSTPRERYTMEPWPAWPDKLGAQQTQKRSPRFVRTRDLEPCWGKNCPARSTLRNASEHIITSIREARPLRPARS